LPAGGVVVVASEVIVEPDVLSEVVVPLESMLVVVELEVSTVVVLSDVAAGVSSAGSSSFLQPANGTSSKANRHRSER